ncbi:MAG: DNA repair protein RecO [Clostridia bacterium]|nr:DNA repair protein RecO [Clostridia bacterium]
MIRRIKTEMDEITVKGLVVKSSDLGENDKLITIVTEDRGKLSASVKGGRSLKSKFVSVSEPFSFSTFCLRKTSKYYYLYDGELIDDFYSVRESIEKLSLAAYICDIASELSLEGVADEDLLKLTLNALYALAYKDADLSHVKSAYEFKASVISGYMPSLGECGICGKSQNGDSFIDVKSGILVCESCISLPQEVNGIGVESVVLPVSKATLDALRFLESSPINKFLSFRITGDEGNYSTVCEKYLTCHLEKDFYTLAFYKSLDVNN